MPRGVRNPPQLPGGQPEPQPTAAPTAAEQASRLPDPAPDAPEGEDDVAYRIRASTLQPEEVDATRLRRAVLTAKGWVCPATSPAAKAKE
jgi:hypothetical protein